MRERYDRQECECLYTTSQPLCVKHGPGLLTGTHTVRRQRCRTLRPVRHHAVQHEIVVDARRHVVVNSGMRPTVKVEAHPRRVVKPDDLVRMRCSVFNRDQFVVVHIAPRGVPFCLFLRPGVDDAMYHEEHFVIWRIRRPPLGCSEGSGVAVCTVTLREPWLTSWQSPRIPLRTVEKTSSSPDA